MPPMIGLKRLNVSLPLRELPIWSSSLICAVLNRPPPVMENAFVTSNVSSA